MPLSKTLRACLGTLNGPCPDGCQVAPPRLRCVICAGVVADQRARTSAAARRPKPKILRRKPCQGPITGTPCPHKDVARNRQATRCEACRVANRSLVNKACHRAYATRNPAGSRTGAHSKSARREQRRKLWAQMEALERQDPGGRYSGREGLKALAREAGLIPDQHAA